MWLCLTLCDPHLRTVQVRRLAQSMMSANFAQGLTKGELFRSVLPYVYAVQSLCLPGVHRWCSIVRRPYQCCWNPPPLPYHRRPAAERDDPVRTRLLLLTRVQQAELLTIFVEETLVPAWGLPRIVAADG